MVPNLGGVMAESPALLRSYWQLQKNLQELGKLTPAEDNIVQTAIAYENGCAYCVAGHTMVGKVFFNSSDEQLAALRTGAQMPTAKEEALKTFSLAVYEKQGRVTDAELKAFLDAGYTREQALEIVGSIAAKVMTNFTNQLAKTPVDSAFHDFTKGLLLRRSARLLSGSKRPRLKIFESGVGCLQSAPSMLLF